MPRLIGALLILACAGCELSSDAVQAPLPGADSAVVFDIDGTLTPDVHSVRTARDGAAKAVQTWADAGHTVVYLSARVTFLQSRIPDWLEDHGFPDGPIHVTETAVDRDDPAVFKSRVLMDYEARGWTFAAAYGDSSTDFKAYADSGIPRERVFALRREGAEHCEPGEWSACAEGWGDLVGAIHALAGAGE